MLKGYRVATPSDYQYILALLLCGSKGEVLVHSVNTVGVEPYRLTEISKGPYSLTSEGLSGFSLGGEKSVIRIVDNPLHNIELKRGDSEWFAPEMSSIVLLVPVYVFMVGHFYTGHPL